MDQCSKKIEKMLWKVTGERNSLRRCHLFWGPSDRSRPQENVGAWHPRKGESDCKAPEVWAIRGLHSAGWNNLPSYTAGMCQTQDLNPSLSPLSLSAWHYRTEVEEKGKVDVGEGGARCPAPARAVSFLTIYLQDCGILAPMRAFQHHQPTLSCWGPPALELPQWVSSSSFFIYHREEPTTFTIWTFFYWL